MYQKKKFLKKTKDLNEDNTVSGILVQLPLPKQISKEKNYKFNKSVQRC